MESRFDLKTALATWRQFQVRRQGFLTEDLDELEVHLRAHMAELRHQGMSDEAAFREAVRALGDLADAEPAYRRVYWGKLRRRSQVMDELRSRATMLGNYLKIALRTLRRQKGYSFINIAGLTLGMACCLLLFQYVAFETNFDAFNTKKDRLYRATFGYTRGDGQEGVSATSVLAFGPTMAEHVPGILRYARILPTYGGVVLSDPGASDSRSLTEERALFVD
ncbi:MAG: permease prefix domain 1-containing protein, partial [Rhodothermales bacterium]